MNKVNIYDSPILACLSGNTTIYVVLDFGTTSSLITLQKAKSLGLNIWRTQYTVIQADGQSTLKIVGETHTTFYRDKIPLKFSALIVANIPVDVLGGTNCYKKMTCQP